MAIHFSKEYIKALDKNLKLLAREIKKRLENQYDVVIGITGYPGCQPSGSKVMMANGSWKNIENIKKGDSVLSPQKDGTCKYSKVINTTKWFCEKNYDIYELNRNKKKLYSCSFNHLVPLHCVRYPRKNGIRNNKNKIWKIENLKADYFSKISKESKARKKVGFSSFLINKFMNRKNCKIEPYCLGVFLGDGSFTKHLSITNSSFELIKEISKYYPIMNIYKKSKTNQSKQYSFSLRGNFAKELSSYNLRFKRSGDKFIPKEALYSDSEYRKRLLAGLIDTDGYYKNGGYSITTKSKLLAKNILFLVYSLGGRGTLKKIEKSIKKINFVGKYYDVHFYLHDLKIPLKINYKKKNVNSIYLASNRIAIDCIKSDKKEYVYGFELDSQSKWYITDNFMVTHNTGKSVLAIILGALIDKSYDLVKNICFIPTSKSIETKYLGLPQRAVLHIDEASRGLHKHKWQDKVQQKLNELFDTEREDHYLCTLLLMPRFQNFTENFRNFRINIWINLIERGIAIVYKRDEDKDCKDPWHLEENYRDKLKKYWKGKKIFERTPYDIVNVESKTSNYWFYFTFPDFPEDIGRTYRNLKADSRITKEVDLEIESYADRVQREKFEKWGKIVKLKNEGHTYIEISAELGVSPETVRRHLRQIEAWNKMKGNTKTQPTNKEFIIFNLKDRGSDKEISGEFNKI